MDLSISAILWVPVLAWATAGLGLWAAFPRSTSRQLLRLATIFVALWALLATTALLWIVAYGAPGVLALATDPLAAVTASALPLWFFGALGAFTVCAVAFLLNQIAGRGLLSVLASEPLPWPSRLPPPMGHTELLRIDRDAPEAFSFTLVAWDPSGIGRPYRRELIIVSRGLEAILSIEELDAVVAHELAHIEDLDSRYLTFFRTFARMMRFDPVLSFVASRLTDREEFEADRVAAHSTHRPVALARALFKVLEATAPAAGPTTRVGLLGREGARRRAVVLARIVRLLDLAESKEFREGPAGE
jgi:Zn-dependent protease with chaperone function